jgi:hypothetical protein
MFAVEERDRVQERLLALAESDLAIVGTAITGSLAAGEGDRWSDLDLAFAVEGDLDAALERFCCPTGWKSTSPSPRPSTSDRVARSGEPYSGARDNRNLHRRPAATPSPAWPGTTRCTPG